VLVQTFEATLRSDDAPHQPVLLAETRDLLAPRPGMTIVDATLGPGGHAAALLEDTAPDGRVIGIDRDPAAVAFSRRRLERFGDRFVGLSGDHRDIEAICRNAGVFDVDGVIADLGISSLQLDDRSRGFSFQQDGPLDMRIDATSGPTAADLVATLDEAALADLLSRWGEERAARRIARAIVRERGRATIATTGALRDLVVRVLGPAAGRFRIHPATRTFQALRIAVNGEVEGIPSLVRGAVSLLRSEGRLAVISFHSLEDRAVKRTMRELSERCVCPPDLPVCACGKTALVRVLTSRPIAPSEHEIRRNPRARSARLRGLEKI
jgi:16S rRNA (cytosine1402-N4)-methyltransferase